MGSCGGARNQSRKRKGKKEQEKSSKSSHKRRADDPRLVDSLAVIVRRAYVIKVSKGSESKSRASAREPSDEMILDAGKRAHYSREKG